MTFETEENIFMPEDPRFLDALAEEKLDVFPFEMESWWRDLEVFASALIPEELAVTLV